MRPLRAGAAGLLLVLVGLLAIGCGGSGAAKTVTVGANGRASATPAALLREMRAALSVVKSYHVAGTSRDKQDGRVVLTGDVTAAGPARFTLRAGASTVQLISLGSVTYIRGNRAYWQKTAGAAHGAQLTDLLSDQWVQAPGNTGAGADAVFQQLLPKRLALCTARSANGVSRDGTGTVGGKPVVQLSQSSAPGQAPGVLSIAATGPALPLQITQTGPEPAGGTKDPLCDAGGPNTTITSVARLSRFDVPVTITAPAHVLDLSKVTLGGATSA